MGQGRGQAQHGVQRGAHLVADVGEEAIPHLGGLSGLRLGGFQSLERAHVVRHLEPDGRIGLGPAIGSEIGHDGGVHPIGLARLLAVLDRSAPDLAPSDGAVEALEIVAPVRPGVHHPVGLADQFVSGVAADRFKLVVAIQDATGAIRDRHDSGLVERG
ncbi:hypothetical protein D3C80_1326040 [compost metagenome]